ncbi:MAG: methylenetetrahydrofolate reductase C-terminal domain-containing protein [Chloroflexi bacterium]|nr:methylenetetrahydrofolate reductase C-terminal domain-containing protein [Chloroflexota bacterium]
MSSRLESQFPSTPSPTRREGEDGLASAPPTLRSLLTDTTTFVRIVELVTTRGPLTQANASRIVALAKRLAETGTVNALSITDNAGGLPQVTPETIGALAREHRQDVIVHLSCKDRNRNGLESRAWALASAGFENVLCLSGDYPVAGYQGQATPVFDIDSVGLLEMLREMNQGLRLPASKKGETATLPPTHFFLGAAVSPFKQHERELLPQFLKLARKIASGANFIIPQLGYDSRKLDELLKYMALKQLTVPIVANIYVLTGAVARYFHRGSVAGVVVSDELAALAEKQAASPDKGKKFFHEFAAKQVAVARGLGYRGAYMGGNLKPEEFQAIFALADSFGPDDWQTFAREIQFPQPNEFSLFELDPATGLSSPEINRAYLASLTPEGRRSLLSKVPVAYRFNRFVHRRVFEEGTPGFATWRRIYSRIEGSPATKQWFHVAEQAIKIPMFGCHDCGDCSLPDIAYLCPESQCAKNQRNGPCGGSHQGICEVGSKECIWTRAYTRLKPYGEEERMLDRPVVFKDGSLKGSSAWANTFLGRDHHAKVHKKEE